MKITLLFWLNDWFFEINTIICNFYLAIVWDLNNNLKKKSTEFFNIFLVEHVQLN